MHDGLRSSLLSRWRVLLFSLLLPCDCSILHDAAGTEMGILIIAVLTYLSPALAEEDNSSNAQ
jgi:hypothetical protein